MIAPLAKLAFTASLIVSPLVTALSPTDIPSDTPVSQLIQTAKAQLASGNAQEALLYFDVAISRDPRNYMTVFNRGAAYLSLGKSQQARRDFDKVLQLRPGFEGALIQRAKLKARSGDWEDAERDYIEAGRSKKSEEIGVLHNAHSSAMLAKAAEEAGNWEECVQQASPAIMVAAADSGLRKLRARCRFERGEVQEGVSDLQHILVISSGDIEPHLQISALQFYVLGETETGLAQMRKCLQSDPDSKQCMKLMKRQKALAKKVNKVRSLVQKKQNVAASKLLTKSGDEPGLLVEVKQDLEEHKKNGVIHQNLPNGLYASLLDLTCEVFIEMSNHKRGEKYCTEVLEYDSNSLPGLIAKAKRHIEADEFEAALTSLNTAKEHHGQSERVQRLLNEAQTLLKRSKQKDYYKVLGVDRDADQRDIKKAMRREAKKYHPDKATSQGISKEEAEKKMAAINEAYEVLSDPELRARFDRGDDPNDPMARQGGNPFEGSPFGGHQQFVFRSSSGGFQFPGGFPGGPF